MGKWGEQIVIPFQDRVADWVKTCFGDKIAKNKAERHFRFLEEALELFQAGGYTHTQAETLLDYVFDRPPGDIEQEVGGVLVTLAALCEAHGVDMSEAGEHELFRCWHNLEKIRAKQAAKPLP